VLIYRAGRDASRAYVTGCFETHLTPDLRGFGEAEMQASTLMLLYIKPRADK